MRRYQVKAESREWTDPGPDLLRARAGAVAAATGLLKWRRVYVGRRLRANGGGAEWRELGGKRAVREWLETALATMRDGDRAQIGERRWEAVEIRAVVRAREVPVVELENATPAVEITNGLVETAFPGSLFAGAFVCKRVSGSSSWSAHAWGDALDRTSSATAPNDAITDWSARMARAGELPVVQILGSRSGVVVEARERLIGSWSLKPSSASDSHLWHVHYSAGWHTGIPPCAR